MSLTCQTVIDRAKAFNPLNASLAGDPVELVTRIQQIQQRIFTAIAGLHGSRFATAEGLASGGGSSGRTANLTSLTKPMERIRRVALPSGIDVNAVTEFDIYMQLAPRYYILGTSLVEVDNDWSASSGSVTLSVSYAYGPTPITATGGLSQTLTLPDEWADLIIKPLAMYFHLKDPGRDVSEYDRLDREYSQVWNGFLSYVTNYPGDLSRRELLPLPPERESRQ